MDSFRILDSKIALWLNLTGSGNENAAHILKENRITIMLCAFEDKPLILRASLKTGSSLIDAIFTSFFYFQLGLIFCYHLIYNFIIGYLGF